MKKSDIAMIVFIASISVVVSFFIAKSIFGNVYQGTANVKVIDTINPVIVEPNPEIFNSKSINPAIRVYVTEKK